MSFEPREYLRHILADADYLIRESAGRSMVRFLADETLQRTRDSDVDLLARFDATRRISLLDVIHLENQIADLLGCPVELAEEENAEASCSEERRR